MDVVVKSHHCSVNDRFREYVEDKITKLEKLNQRAIRVEVEVSRDRNHGGKHDNARVEITLRTKGPVVRAEACAEEKQAAFDLALDKLLTQLRKAADRRRVHHGYRRPRSLAEATSVLPPEGAVDASEDESDTHVVAGMQVQGDGPMVVREKVHKAAPMTLDQALTEMELVGHDFFLFVHATSGLPSVVYRRRGYDYGVISLDSPTEAPETAHATATTNGHVPAAVGTP